MPLLSRRRFYTRSNAALYVPAPSGGAAATTLSTTDKTSTISVTGPANVAWTCTGLGSVRTVGTLATNQRIYFEMVYTNIASAPYAGIGNIDSDIPAAIGAFSGAGNTPSLAAVFRGFNDTYLDLDSANNGNAFASAPAVNGDVLCIAFDSSNLKTWGRLNGGDWNNNASNTPNVGSQVGGFNVAITASRPFYVLTGSNASGDAATMRFASLSWGFTPPTGFGQL